MKLKLAVYAGLSWLSVLSGSLASETPITVAPILKYAPESVDGRDLKDLSPFHNDARGVGMEYDTPITEVDDGFSLDWALVPRAESLAPENFVFSCEMKLTKSVANALLYQAYVSPFYLKDRTLIWKEKEQYFPEYDVFSVRIVNDRVVARIACRNAVGDLKPIALTAKAPLKIGAFQTVKVSFAAGRAELFIDGRLQESRPVPGPIRYRPAELYPGHFNAMLKPSRDIVFKSIEMADSGVSNRPAPAMGIKVTTDKYLNFFASEEPVTLKVGVANLTEKERSGTLYHKVVDHAGEALFRGETSLTLDPLEEAVVPLKFKDHPRGCFWVKCAFRDQDGEVARWVDQYAVGRFTHDLGDVPDSSPFGADNSEFWLWDEYRRSSEWGWKWVRVEMMWPVVQPKKGEIHWEKYDKIFDYYRKQGRKIYVTLNRTPAWAMAADYPKDKDFEHSKISGLWYENDPGERERYLRELATRYKGSIWGYDILGEANIQVLYALDKYLALNKLTRDVIRGVDPDAKLCGPTACRAGFDPTTERLLKTGAMKYWDRFDTHYIGGSGGINLTPEESVEKEIAGSRALMAKYGEVLPMMDGESGYPIAQRRAPDMTVASPEELKTAQNREEGLVGVIDWWAPKPNRYTLNCRDEVTVSEYYVRRMALCLANDVKPTIVHNVGKVEFAADMPRWAGKHDTGVTLAAVALATMADKLSWADFTRKIALPFASLYGYLFKDNKRGQNIALLWSAAAPVDVILNPDADGDKPKLYDIWGNPAKFRELKNGQILLTLSEAPVYLEGVGDHIVAGKQALSLAAPTFISGERAETLKVTLYNPFAEAFSGSVKIVGDGGARVEPAGFAFALKPGETVEKNVIVMAEAGTKAERATLTVSANSPILSCRSTVTVKVEAPPYRVTRREKPIVVDGKDDDWAGAAAPMRLTGDAQVIFGYPRSFDPVNRKPETEWQGKDDLGADVYALWDQDNLYLLSRVKDKIRDLSTRFTDAPFNSDGVELFIDGRKEKLGAPGYGPGVRHIRINPGDKTRPATTVSVKPVDGVRADDWKIEAASAETPDGYILEIKIPIDKRYLPELEMAPDRLIGFNIYLNDADGKGHKAIIAWTPKTSCDNQPQNFGKLRLK